MVLQDNNVVSEQSNFIMSETTVQFSPALSDKCRPVTTVEIVIQSQSFVNRFSSVSGALLESLTFIPRFVFKAYTSIMSSDETSLKIIHLDRNMDIQRLLI